jgi:hypothetical protein
MTRTSLATVGIAAASFAIFATTAAATAYVPWPWDTDWRQRTICQKGEPATCFAPPGCFIERWVTVRHAVTWQRLFVCR